MYENIDNRKLNISVFFEFKKAFDTVKQRILLSTLALYVIAGVSHNWFATYLVGRDQFCFLKGQSSSKSKIQYGILQGSCLRPLLLIWYINDFKQCLQESYPNLYADATTMTYAVLYLLELRQDINSDLYNISE